MDIRKGLDALFQPRSIALVGASHSEEKLSGVILKNLLRFRGEVYPVNPRYDSLMGLRTYPSIRDIPTPVDLSIIIRPAREISDLIREHKGMTGTAIIVSSGFAEVGETELQEEVLREAREAGIRLLGPNCMGVLNPARRLDSFFIPRERMKRPPGGNVAVVSQSGAIMTYLFGGMTEARIGASKAVNYGNASDIDEADIYDYLREDGNTELVVSYIESVGDGRRFLEAANRLSAAKPLLILKAGKGTSGQAAAYSHTGRLAGSYEVFRSLCRRSGIREAGDFDELMDAAKALSCQRPSPGKRVCIITNGGGSGVLAADECMRTGLDLPPLPGEKRERLRRGFPSFYGVNNPVDLTAQVQDRDYVTVLEELREEYDGFLVIALTAVKGVTEELAGMISDLRIEKPVVFHVARGGAARNLVRGLERGGIPVYPSPERAVRGLGALLL